MKKNETKKLIIKLKENNKIYQLYNDGSIVDEELNVILDKGKDRALIDKIIGKFKHGFSDDIRK